MAGDPTRPAADGQADLDEVRARLARAVAGYADGWPAEARDELVARIVAQLGEAVGSEPVLTAAHLYPLAFSAVLDAVNAPPPAVDPDQDVTASSVVYEPDQNEAPADAPGADDAEQIWAAAAGELSEEETLEVVEHALTSPPWAAAWRLAAALGADGWEGAALPALAERLRAASAPAPAPKRWWVGSAAIGAVTLLFGGIVLGSLFGSAGDPATITSALDGGSVTRESAVLSWEPPAEEAVYAVTVSSTDGEVIYEARQLSEPGTTVPPAALVHIDTLMWQVRAELPSGRRMTGSFRTEVHE